MLDLTDMNVKAVFLMEIMFEEVKYDDNFHQRILIKRKFLKNEF